MDKSSSRPLGATTYKETAFGILPQSKLLKLEIDGVKRGLEYIHDCINKPSFLITPEYICELHKISFGWIFPDWAGKYRTIQVQYSDKEAPPYFRIPEMVLNLCDDLKTRIKSLPKVTDDKYISEVVRNRTGKEPKEYYRFLLDFIDKINPASVLSGLGEVLTTSQKDWAKAKLTLELKGLIQRQIDFL